LAKVLLVEDEPALLEALEYSLAKQGYEVLSASDGAEGLNLALSEWPDLLVLDIMLPGIDGLEVCRRLRQHSSVPIIMLTALADEVDKVVGLELGADDYVTKPFAMRELLARVKAQLRRVQMTQQEATTESDSPRPQRMLFGDLCIDEARHEATLRGRALALKPREYDLLAFMARNRGMVLSRELILERVWGWSYDGGSRTVDVHIRWLREKIEPSPSQPVRIVTVRGVGYRFEG
jgi:DNA-binding response OmpR family regulator